MPIGKLESALKNGELIAKAAIVYAITDLAMFLNLGKERNMTGQQIAQTAEMILQKYNYLKLDDLKLCFNNAKQGVYGKIYDRLDGQVIFEFLNAYSDSRAVEAERLNLLAHDRHKKDLFEGDLMPDSDRPTAADWKGLKDSLKALSQNVKQKEKIVIPKTETELMIQKYLTDFQVAWIKGGFEVGGVKFISVKFQRFNQVEYAEFRLKRFLGIQRIEKELSDKIKEINQPNL